MMVPKKQSKFQFFIITVIVLAVLFSQFAAFYADYLWFDSIGFKLIFLTSLKAKIALFFATALFFLAFTGVNLFVANKLHHSKVSFKKIILGVLGLSFIIGIFSSSAWMTVLQYFNQTGFGKADPIFGLDAAFYIFSLPLYMSFWYLCFITVIISLIVVAIYYFHQVLQALFSQRQVDPNTNMVRPINFKAEFAKIKKFAFAHLAILASLFFVLIAIKNYLSRYSVMYSESGIVVGAGYTDINVFLPVVSILAVISVILAIAFILWIFVGKKKELKKHHIIFMIVVLYFVISFLGKTLVPGIVQSLVVSPNEINLEQPYIENNIEFTKYAYGLDNVEEEDFMVQLNISQSVLEMESKTIDNVRILDWRPLTKTYKQTQEIRLYYDLSGIDIDRYFIDGKYTEVMLAPRELDQNQITPNARTWVNEHLVYSHGFGIVMSPVNSITKEGLPNYLIKDIPPVYQVDDPSIRIDEPRIYYGEKDNSFILVNTNTEEFDYPKGNSNEYVSYGGKGGVVLDSLFKKIVMALKFADIKILLSSDLTPESKIMFNRNIEDRISKITPFLMFDNDPYIVINEGRLYWMIDAYTTTDRFPYSQLHYDSFFNSFNYIRNSVKIVVDAYNGDVTYYVADLEDPLMQTYVNIYPNQFRLLEHMPEGLKSHIRYPEDLFKIQSEIYSIYHMSDTKVFYNKEDAWQIPSEIYGTGEKVRVEPYYIIMKLPGEDTEEFVILTTFTPSRKDNMIAWFAARSDGENYGKLLLYKFPKDSLVYGPLQIEAKIDQDSEISQQLTLWSQQGSRVTRGNLLVIPIQNSLLYIEPLYIQAEQGQLPELKRVIVSDGESVVMEQTFDEALSTLFGKPIITYSSNGTVSDSYDLSEIYDSVLSSMKEGDWVSFGENFDRLGKAIEVVTQE